MKFAHSRETILEYEYYQYVLCSCSGKNENEDKFRINPLRNKKPDSMMK